ncbi:DUF4065 domain-containing protein [Listeria monocytogenes]|nr:DUF4065 domain-containing protein [Listeria monocytogenes]HAB7139236.1 DUF4065 domain-containing protein [Listeria monocytogenes]HAB7751339.1 DUF4065 domain-containing protein [Listeria monocytogenes]HAB7758143.1 DUF4065 domain-containing protein [Listeria monocytogenes]HAB7762105.1 DUF4065 domain-containing protein [Listeria monocytogenes]
MYTVDQVAEWFLSKDSMTHKKLQKLLYYAYSWTLTLMNDDKEDLKFRLFDEKIEAWVHGPVIPKIYQNYKYHEYNTIFKINKEVDLGDKDVEGILEQVLEVYGEYDGNELESITHQEEPWQEARKGYGPLDRCNEVINDKTIFETYIKRVA